MSLPHTRAIIDAIHSGELARSETIQDPVFGVQVPIRCSGVPSDALVPKKSWGDPAKFDETAKKLARLFQANFTKFEAHASEGIRSAGPRV
jgi:phosphoenolpyruvate carboxykinase (ATP)